MHMWPAPGVDALSALNATAAPLHLIVLAWEAKTISKKKKNIVRMIFLYYFNSIDQPKKVSKQKCCF